MEVLIGLILMGAVAAWAVAIMDKSTGIISGPFRLFKLLSGPLAWLFFPHEKPKGARFLSENETEQILKPRNKGLLIDGKQRRISPEDSFKNAIVIAQVGAGKSRRYVMPNILTLDNCSFVITDPAGELYANTAGDLAKRGYKIYVLNPSDPMQSNRYNPLKRASTYTQFQEVASVLVDSAVTGQTSDGGFWNNGAKELIELFIACLYRYGKTHKYTYHLPNVYQLLQRLFDAEAMDVFIAQYAPDESYVDRYASLISGQNEKTVQSYLSTALNALKSIGNPDMAQLFINDDFRFSLLRKEKTAIFLIVPADRIAPYSYVMNLFYSQLFSSVMRSIEPSDLPFYAILDEFGHYNIPHFDTIMTTARKYKVSISLILQSVHQLYKQYGDHGAKTIMGGGIATRVFYSGMDLETAKMVEQMLGKVQIVQKTRGGEKHVREENLMNADRLMRIATDQAIALVGNNEPMMFPTYLVHDQRHFVKRMQLPHPPLPSKKSLKIKRVEFFNAQEQKKNSLVEKMIPACP